MGIHFPTTLNIHCPRNMHMHMHMHMIIAITRSTITAMPTAPRAATTMATRMPPPRPPWSTRPAATLTPASTLTRSSAASPAAR